MIYLRIIDNKVSAFADLNSLKLVTGSDVADKTITEKEWRDMRNSAHVVDGKIVFGPTTEELFTLLRYERDLRLQATDYLMMADYPLSDEGHIKISQYRQALRNLPSLTGAPWDGGGDKTPWPVFPAI